MKTRRLPVPALILALVLALLTGCGPTEGKKTVTGTGLDKLGTVNVISREEGSGTREVFSKTLGLFDDSTGRDEITEDALKEESGDKVIEAVSEDESAIGYVSLGLLDSSKGKVHTVTVDGKSLNRNFYLAYSGKLSELEKDFLTYVEGKGQEIVGENYQTVKKTTTFLSGKPKGTIKIGGSSSVASLMQELSDAYMQINPNAEITVVTTDSTNGLTGAMSGIYDLGMASRELKDYEKELLDYDVIAKDEVAVIVQKDNPLKNISSQDLKKIYSGEMKEWKELAD